MGWTATGAVLFKMAWKSCTRRHEGPAPVQAEQHISGLVAELGLVAQAARLATLPPHSSVIMGVTVEQKGVSVRVCVCVWGGGVGVGVGGAQG